VLVKKEQHQKLNKKPDQIKIKATPHPVLASLNWPLMKRYEALADKIATLIRSGAIKAGDRIPSIRQASARYNVSPSTVFQAYYRLEGRGLIRARERSGYYVSDKAPRLLPEPQASQAVATSSNVTVSELVFSVLESMQDTDIAPLGAAYPAAELFPLEKLAQSLARANRHVDPSSSGANLSPGNEALRRAISLRYMTSGLSVGADEVLITNGALEGLTLALQAITEPGDLVAIESPTFYAVLQIVERLKLKAIEIPVHPSEGLDLDVLSEALKNNTISACWCMSNFQNPMGATMPETKKQALVTLLGQYEVPLIEDDVYGELYFGSTYPKPAKAFDEQGLVIHCGSFSKSLAPGYRIGWVIAGRYQEQIRRAKLMTTLSASVPAQLAIADYIGRGGYDRHLRKLRHLLEDQQALMTSAIATHFPVGTKVTRPRGGYFLWLELPDNIDSLTLYHECLAKGINLAPGPIFSASEEYSNCIRLNYGQPLGQITSAVEAIGRIARGLYQ